MRGAELGLRRALVREPELGLAAVGGAGVRSLRAARGGAGGDGAVLLVVTTPR
ncbi:MAG TPA: hypothetical protein VD903_01135 [Pseudonocardia sp.]|nr:hypothetical protein [Pseudonocardia sp.]